MTGRTPNVPARIQDAEPVKLARLLDVALADADADLRTLLDAWPHLTLTVRRTLGAMAKAAAARGGAGGGSGRARSVIQRRSKIRGVKIPGPRV